MEGESKALLAEARHLLGVAENEGPLGDDYMLTVFAVDGIGDHDLEVSCELTVEPVYQNGIDRGPLKDRKRLAMC